MGYFSLTNLFTLTIVKVLFDITDENFSAPTLSITFKISSDIKVAVCE
jgi:hypothetical protein